MIAKNKKQQKFRLKTGGEGEFQIASLPILSAGTGIVRTSRRKSRQKITNDKKQRKALTKENQDDIIQTMAFGYPGLGLKNSSRPVPGTG